MNRFLSLAAFTFLCSCNGNEADTSQSPAMNITGQNRGLSLTVDNYNEKNASLLVNGKKVDPVNLSGETIIGDAYLLPGMNYLHLVSGTDTLADSTFFSYKLEYQLVKEYKHDITNFTEGLFIEGNILYESTGLEGQSKIRRYQMNGPELSLINEINNEKTIFGEGIAAVGNSLYQLTWENHVVYEYDKNTLKKKKEFQYPNDGWGLTPNGDSLLASDGSAFLYFIRPAGFEVYNKIEVKGENGPVKEINELELVGKIVVANVWQTNTLIFIHKETGLVVATADLSALANSASQENPKRDVLNGIAYDPADGTFIVTGKFWTKLYRIRFDEKFDQLLKSL